MSVAVNSVQKKPPEEGAKFFSRKNKRKNYSAVLFIVLTPRDNAPLITGCAC